MLIKIFILNFIIIALCILILVYSEKISEKASKFFDIIVTPISYIWKFICKILSPFSTFFSRMPERISSINDSFVSWLYDSPSQYFIEKHRLLYVFSRILLFPLRYIVYPIVYIAFGGVLFPIGYVLVGAILAPFAILYITFERFDVTLRCVFGFIVFILIIMQITIIKGFFEDDSYKISDVSYVIETNDINSQEKPYYTLHIDQTPTKHHSPSTGNSEPDRSLEKYLETDISSPSKELDADEIIISKTDTTYCGDMAHIEIKVEPNTEYFIAVYYKSGRSNADGLSKKTSDDNGYIKWSWRVGTRTSAGEYRIEVYNQEKTYVTSFIVK